MSFDNDSKILATSTKCQSCGHLASSHQEADFESDNHCLVTCCTCWSFIKTSTGASGRAAASGIVGASGVVTELKEGEISI